MIIRTRELLELYCVYNVCIRSRRQRVYVYQSVSWLALLARQRRIALMSSDEIPTATSKLVFTV